MVEFGSSILVAPEAMSVPDRALHARSKRPNWRLRPGGETSAPTKWIPGPDPSPLASFQDNDEKKVINARSREAVRTPRTGDEHLQVNQIWARDSWHPIKFLPTLPTVLSRTCSFSLHLLLRMLLSSFHLRTLSPPPKGTKATERANEKVREGGRERVRAREWNIDPPVRELGTAVTCSNKSQRTVIVLVPVQIVPRSRSRTNGIAGGIQVLILVFQKATSTRIATIALLTVHILLSKYGIVYEHSPFHYKRSTAKTVIFYEGNFVLSMVLRFVVDKSLLFSIYPDMIIKKANILCFSTTKPAITLYKTKT